MRLEQLNMITDRTRSDVNFAAAYRETPEPQKGAYNASDMNRVGTAVNYLSGLLYKYGYGRELHLKTDWSVTDLPAYADAVEYIDSILFLRQVYFTLPETPPLPRHISELFLHDGHLKANDIERFLLDVEFILRHMIASFHHANEFYSGEHTELSGFETAAPPTWAELKESLHTWRDVKNAFANWGQLKGSWTEV